MRSTTPEIRKQKPKIPRCHDCKTIPQIEVEQKEVGLGIWLFVACRCKEGRRANSGAAAIEVWNAGEFVKHKKPL